MDFVGGLPGLGSSMNRGSYAGWRFGQALDLPAKCTSGPLVLLDKVYRIRSNGLRVDREVFQSRAAVVGTRRLVKPSATRRRYAVSTSAGISWRIMNPSSG